MTIRFSVIAYRLVGCITCLIFFVVPGAGITAEQLTCFGAAPTSNCEVDGVANSLCVSVRGNSTIIGSAENDVIIVSKGRNNVIDAMGGDNRICARTGNNRITTGSGNDSIQTGRGHDTIDAGDGDNIIDAGSGKNRIDTGAGNDTIETGKSNDTIDAGDGDNIIDAGSGKNRINTGAGNDTIETGKGNDTIAAGDGDNTIHAGSGKNRITTGAGNDTIETGNGPDRIDSGGGEDFIDAGKGKDTCVNGEIVVNCENIEEPAPVASRAVPKPNDGPGSQEAAAENGDADAVEIYPYGSSTVLNTGEERLTRVDLVIPGRGGIHFSMVRRYRSKLDYDGPLGHGWDFNYNQALFVQPNGDVLRSNGLGHIDRWVLNPDGSYAPPKGFYGTLLRNPDATFVYREPDGFKCLYDADGKLVAQEDRHGNRLELRYDANGNLQRVTDVYGRIIDYQFEIQADGVARLTEIRDFIGREIQYRYDARGDLVEATGPAVLGTSTDNDFPQGKTERYGYSSGFAEAHLNHNLLSVTAPEEVANGGPAYMNCTYGTDPGDLLTFDRVLETVKGGTNASGVAAGGTITYRYEALNTAEPPGNLDLPRRKVTVTERNGNRFEFFANERGHAILHRRLTRGLRADEPAFYETRSEYNADGLLTRRVFPQGNELLHRYDDAGPRAAQRNLIELRRRADGNRGGGEDLVTTMTYEPVYNRLASLTDPRGNAAGFAPPLGDASPERYTTRLLFDYQEGSDPIADVETFDLPLRGIQRGLGDLNGDARTDQSAGNPVRIRAPTVQLPAGSNEAARLGGTSQTILTEQQWNDRGQLLRYIDPEGNVDVYDYFPANDPDGDGTVTSGGLAALAEPTGYLKTMARDAEPSPRRSAAAAPVALTTAFRYDRVGNVVAIKNPRGVVTAVEVNQLNQPVVITRGADITDAVASGQLLTGEAPFRYLARAFYDHNSRLTELQTENRDSTTFGVGDFVDRGYRYDILDNLLESSVEVDASTTVTTTFRYDENELRTRLRQPEGNVVATVYDERNLPFTQTRGFGSADASTTRVDYDLNANPRRFVDAEDNDGDGGPEASTLTYDGFDRVVETLDALGNRTLNSYDVASNRIRRQFLGHPPGRPEAANVRLTETLFRHDELNRVFQVDQPLFLAAGFAPSRPIDLRDQNADGLVTNRFEYDALSRLTFTVEDDDELGRIIYDGASRPIATMDAEGNRRTMEYDQNSNPTVVRLFERATDDRVPEEEFVAFYVWDQLDRIARVSADHTARYRHDSRDNLVSITDAQGTVIDDPFGFFPGTINDDGNSRTFFYDGRDLMIAMAADLRQSGQGGEPLDHSNPFNPDGKVDLTYVFDGNSRLAAIVDDNLNETRYDYDALNRPIQQTNADLTAYRSRYDRDSNLIETIDPNGTRIDSSYDVLNRLIQRQIDRSAGIAGTAVETYAYDGLSRLTAANDDNGAAGADHGIERVYDSLSRLLEEHQDQAVCSSVWSGDSRRLALTYPGARRIDFDHDRVDRILAITEDNAPIADYAWIGPGHRLLERTQGNDTRLTLLNDTGDESIGWDQFRRIVQLRHINGSGAFVERLHAYNRADQRLSESRLDQSGLTDRHTYDSLYRVFRSRYDEAGAAGAPLRDLRQIERLLDGVGNRREETRLSESSGIGVEAYDVNEVNEYTQIGAAVRTHDDNGNLGDNGALTFVFDYKDRLVAANTPDGDPVATYEYDVFNRRVKKTLFDPDRPGVIKKETRYRYDGWQAIEEQNGNGDTETTYVYGVQLDEPIQMRNTAQSSFPAGTYYLHQNARGDVVALTDDFGALVEKTTFQAFGAPDRSSSVGNPYLLQGRRLDPETGFYYFRNRYYDPDTGRFVQRDPVWDAGNVGNQYTFVGNGPVSRGDPLGLFQIKEFALGAWDIVTEPYHMIQDVTKVVGAKIMDIPPEYIELKSGLGNRQRGRIEAGQSPLEASLKGTAEIAIAIPTAGASSFVQAQYELYQAFKSGKITLDEYDKALSRLAGGVTAGAVVAKIIQARGTTKTVGGTKVKVTHKGTTGRRFGIDQASAERSGNMYSVSAHGAMARGYFKIVGLGRKVYVRFLTRPGRRYNPGDPNFVAYEEIYALGRGRIPEHTIGPLGDNPALGMPGKTFTPNGRMPLSQYLQEVLANIPEGEGPVVIDVPICRDVTPGCSYPKSPFINRGAMATSGAVGGTTGMIRVTRNALVAMPFLLGLTEAEARARLKENGLAIGVLDARFSENVPLGRLIEQTPEPGKAVVAGTRVNVVISLGPPPVQVPNVIGLDLEAAKQAIENAGLKVGQILERQNIDVPKNQIFDQAPNAGQSVQRGTTVDLKISLGSATVPEVVGLSQSEAEKAITDAGLKVGEVFEIESDTVPKGRVIFQSPPAGQKVNPGSPVDLQVSLGPAQIIVPVLVLLSQADAEKAITDAGLTVGTVTTRNDEQVPEGQVIEQTPAANTMVAPGSAVDLVISLGPAAPLQPCTPFCNVPLGIPTTFNLDPTAPAGSIFDIVTPPPADLPANFFNLAPNGDLSVTTPLDFPFIPFGYEITRDGVGGGEISALVIGDPNLLLGDPILDGMGTIIQFDVPTVVINGLQYPAYQLALFINPLDACGLPHWHALLGPATIFPIETPNAGITDPALEECGFGLFSDLAIEQVFVPADDWNAFLQDHPPAF